MLRKIPSYYYEPSPYIQEHLLLPALVEKLIFDPCREKFISGSASQLCGLQLKSPQFFILAVNMLDTVPDFDHCITYAEGPDSGWERTVLRLVCSVLENSYLCYPFYYNDQIFVLVNLNPHDCVASAEQLCPVTQQLIAMCRHGIDAVAQHYGIIIQVLISQFIPELGELKRQFDQLCKITGMKYADMPEDSIINLTELLETSGPLTSNADGLYMLELDHAIIHSALAHDFKRTQACFEQMIDKDMKNFVLSITLETRIGARLDTIFGLLGIPYSEHLPTQFSPESFHRLIEDSISIEDLKDNISCILEEFDEFFHPPTIQTASRIEEIAAYIEEQYSDPNLCADQLCGQFGISISHLSRSFKEKMGIKLIDFIQEVRIEHAKLLLDSTDDKMETIANAVGYRSPLTFTRAFNRCEGTTPGFYRRTRRAMNATSCSGAPRKDCTS